MALLCANVTFGESNSKALSGRGALRTIFLPKRQKKSAHAFFAQALFFSSQKLLCFALCLGDDLYSLVVAAVVANAVGEDSFAALGTLNDVSGCCKLPNAGTSLHLSRMRSFSLWYCHCCLPPENELPHGISLCYFNFYFRSFSFLPESF